MLESARWFERARCCAHHFKGRAFAVAFAVLIDVAFRQANAADHLYAVGKTRVFLKTDILVVLDEARNKLRVSVLR